MSNSRKPTAKSVERNSEPAALTEAPAVTAEIVQPALPTLEAPQAKTSVSILDEQQVLTSKRYIKGAFEFRAPSEILTPVIGELSKLKLDITITGSQANANGNTDSTINKAFGRVMLHVRHELAEGLTYEMGVMYALDLTVPKAKIYRGIKVMACLNQCIFGADDIVTINLNNGKELDTVTSYIEEFAKRMKTAENLVRNLKAYKMNEEQVRRAIGDMIIKTVTDKGQTGTTTIMRAIEMLYDSTSKYFVKQEGFSAWHLYNALTEYFEKKVNFWDIPEKAYSTYSLIEHVAGAKQLDLPLN